MVPERPRSVAPAGRWWARAMARAATTGARSTAARPTAALSTTRQATISATSASMPAAGAAVAKAATFQASWASRGRRAAAGWTRTLWISTIARTLAGAVLGEDAPGDRGVERLVVVVANQLVELP